MNKSLLLIAVIAAVGGLVAVEVRAQAKAAPAQTKRFEHACDVVKALPLEPTLDGRSNEGWELVSAWSTPGSNMMFCWKRPAK